MGLALKVIIFLLGVAFVLTVINLLVKRKISERNSFLWLAGSLAILVLSTIPDVLDVMARAAGVDYPPTLLFLLSTLVILFILLYQSIQISVLQQRCKELTQRLAIVNFTGNTGREAFGPDTRVCGEGVSEGGREKYASQPDKCIK